MPVYPKKVSLMWQCLIPSCMFHYTGVPHFPDDISEEDLDNVVNVSKLFFLPELETICRNIKSDEEFLNPSIGTYLNDETGKRMKEMFLNEDKLSDVVFKVEGEFW